MVAKVEERPGTVWVLFRPEQDVERKDPVKGYEIDEDIYPNGGIIIDRPLQHRVGRKGKEGIWEDLTLKDTAHYLSRIRCPLTWGNPAPYPNLEAIPRWSKMQGDQVEKVEEQAAPAKPRQRAPVPVRKLRPVANLNETRYALQREARKIMTAGGPDVELRAPTKVLQDYVDTYASKPETPNAKPEGTGNDSGEGGGNPGSKVDGG
jgi:hypothetical protein